MVTSNTARPSPNKVHTSNVGDLVGGIVGGILAVAIIVSMMFLYRRRRQPALSTRDDVFNQHWNSDQVQSPFLGQETPTLYPSEVTRSPSQETRHYVRIVPLSSACLCSCDFLTLRTRMIQIRPSRTWEPRTLEHRDITACPLSILRL